MQGYSTFPKAPHHHIVFCHIQNSCWGSLTPLQKCSQCILQPQLMGRKRERWLINIEECIHESIEGLRDNIKKIKKRLKTAVSNGNTKTNRKTTKTQEEIWEEKQLHGYFKWQSLGNCAWEDLDMAKKWKPQERNRLSVNSSEKYCHNNKLH